MQFVSALRTPHTVASAHCCFRPVGMCVFLGRTVQVQGRCWLSGPSLTQAEAASFVPVRPEIAPLWVGRRRRRRAPTQRNATRTQRKAGTPHVRSWSATTWSLIHPQWGLVVGNGKPPRSLARSNCNAAAGRPSLFTVGRLTLPRSVSGLVRAGEFEMATAAVALSAAARGTPLQAQRERGSER